MKAERLQEGRVFKPISIKLTFETKEEVRAFFLMMNWTPICEASHVREFIDTGAIRDALGPINYGDQWAEFENSIIKALKR